MKEIFVNNGNFEKEVLNSDKPVLVDFFATWCGPCKILSPTISEVAEEHDEIKVCKIDVDEAPEIANAYNISVIPTLVFIKNGKQIHKQTGLMAKSHIEEIIIK